MDTHARAKARWAHEKAPVCYRKFLCRSEWSMEKSSWVLVGQGIWRDSSTETGSPSWGSFPCLRQAHWGRKRHISCKLISKCLVLPGRQKSGLLTHSARAVKEGQGWWESRHLPLSSPWAVPISLAPVSALSRLSESPPVFSGLLWDASSAMTVAEGSPGQVEA